eukprot:gene6193-7713_t
MGRYSGHGGTHTKNKQYKKARSTKNRSKDIDQVYEDVQPGNIEKRSKFELDPDLPGMGQFYCVYCSKHFVTKESLETHVKSKPHKRRMKDLKTKPYTVKDSQIPVDNGKKLRGDNTDNDQSMISTNTTTTTAVAIDDDDSS